MSNPHPLEELHTYRQEMITEVMTDRSLTADEKMVLIEEIWMGEYDDTACQDEDQSKEEED
jgi:hypothetical protein